MKVIWEWIESELEKASRGGAIWRARVPGGWFIAWRENYYDVETANGLTFYPDPKHEWDGNSLP